MSEMPTEGEWASFDYESSVDEMIASGMSREESEAHLREYIEAKVAEFPGDPDWRKAASTLPGADWASRVNPDPATAEEQIADLEAHYPGGFAAWYMNGEES
jgi:hypothetical protein